ncbi:aminopeptidase P family N-terminal domain-containing protein [Oscillospiraceae bacterium OttesenSCG-928-F05]|nr:aminopeptidase P family N-terminal domain-containing protein [Oscillospiraceae bacterium OttesenSCG-928-F05]
MVTVTPEQIVYAPVPNPPAAMPEERPLPGAAVYAGRLSAVRTAMAHRHYDALVIYADREHYSNFKYLTGFDPRFEEALLVVFKEGASALLLGNECYSLHKQAPFEVLPVLCQILSLPNQPMDAFVSMEHSLREAGLRPGMRTGVVGWKLLPSSDPPAFCTPHMMIAALQTVLGPEAALENAADLFIHPGYGLRCVNDVDTIAYFEYYAAKSSLRLRETLDAIAPGMSEMALASLLNPEGQVQSCHPTMKAGPNATKGLISPTPYRLTLGDPFSAGMGLEGGHSARRGFVAHAAEDLAPGIRDYLDVLAKPYFAAVASWYMSIGVGVSCGEFYAMIDHVLPKARYGWSLNPGHLIGTEEWLSSPVYPGSEIVFKSGMIVQMDLLPSLPGYGGINAEDGVLLADSTLRDALKNAYPDVYARMVGRRAFMAEALGITLGEDVLPLSDIPGVFRPFVLNKTHALKVQKPD